MNPKYTVKAVSAQTKPAYASYSRHLRSLARACVSDMIRRVAALGQELIALHLLEHPDLHIPLCKFRVAGDNRVERVRYDGERVWINAQQHFAPVPEVVWAYRVGGYVVCEKWLADRKGRVLSFDEVLTYQRVVSALARTLELQAQVDRVCRQAWGW